MAAIPPTDWLGLYFDSDGEQLRSGDLLLGILHKRLAWTSPRFSKADLIREWPPAGAAAFATEQARNYWRDRFSSGSERSIRERWRRGWIDRFAVKQRQIRRWIPFVDIADACARAASPVTITEEGEARALTYRRLVESMARGEFERNGRSWVLLLLPDLVASSLSPHRLTQEYFQVVVDTYGLSDFSNDSGLVRENLWFCWLPFDLCREWFERHLLAWPDAFNPKDRVHGDPPASAGQNPNIVVPEPPSDAAAPEKGRRGRKAGSGSFDDEKALHEMLRFLAGNEAPSVHAAAQLVVTSGVAIIISSKESAASRLRRKFAARFGTQPPQGKTWSDIARELETNKLYNPFNITTI